MSARLFHACLCVIDGLELQRTAIIAIFDERRHARWTDAAGASRVVAAVLHVDHKWRWSRDVVPDHVWNTLTPRGDNQIGLQELLAVTIAITTFASVLCGAKVSSYIDNDGVLGGL